MGAWGTGSFENDTAMDWLADLADPQSVRKALAAVADASSESYVDADACCRALGAAEIVAACGGKPGEKVPEKVTSWAASHPRSVDEQLRRLAKAAVDRIETGSELQELFDEGGRDEVWRATLKELVSRLALAN
jgi:hypothetical protein